VLGVVESVILDCVVLESMLVEANVVVADDGVVAEMFVKSVIKLIVEFDWADELVVV
jgi:hypothetical protein